MLSDVDLRLLHRKMVADKSSAVRNAPPRKPWDMYKKNKNKPEPKNITIENSAAPHTTRLSSRPDPPYPAFLG